MSPHERVNGRARESQGFVVETTGLTKRLGDRVAVADVDLRIPRGSAFGYLGPNGAGKTTLIRMLLGLTDASAGTMHLLGRPVPARRAEALARVGAIVEEPRFHGFLTGRENLEIIAAAREPEAHARIDGALARAGLAHRADERVKRYSLGMRQRLGVARSLLGDPELLILDEPTNGLDPAGIHEFRAMIRGFVAEGRTVLFSSRQVTMHARSRSCQGSARSIRRHPARTGFTSASPRTSKPNRRRTRSAAASSSPGWPSVASSRYRPRSSSGS